MNDTVADESLTIADASLSWTWDLNGAAYLVATGKDGSFVEVVVTRPVWDRFVKSIVLQNQK